MLEEAGMSFPGQAELQRYHNMFLKSANYSSLGVQLYLSLLIKSIISNAKNCNLIHELYGEEILWWFGASCSCKARVGNSGVLHVLGSTHLSQMVGSLPGLGRT